MNDIKPLGTAEFRMRLKEVRLQAGLSEQELAVEMGISTASYYDLEACDEELDDVISLGEFLRLCRKIGVAAETLLALDPSTKKLRAEEFRNLVLSGLESGRIEISFLKSHNYDINPFLEDVNRLEELYIYCLRYLCERLGIEFVQILP